MNTRIKLIITLVCFCILPVVVAAWLMLNRVESEYIYNLQAEQQLYLDTVAGFIDTQLDGFENNHENVKSVLDAISKSTMQKGSRFYLTDDGVFVYGMENNADDVKPVFDGMARNGQQRVKHASGLIIRKTLSDNKLQLLNVIPSTGIAQEFNRIRWQAALLLTIAVVAICCGATLVYGYFTTQSAKAKAFVYRLGQQGLPLPGSAPDGECEDICAAMLNQAELLRKCEHRLNEVNITDPLTGVYNRQTILAKLEDEMAKTNRYATPLSAIALTVDRYSSVFERFGYEIADDVLCRLTALLQASLRSHDLVGRLEANLFLIILPLTQVENGKVICDRIRSAAEESYWGSPDLQLTISGAAVEPRDVNDTLEMFDELIQLAKGQGGNRIVMKES